MTDDRGRMTEDRGRRAEGRRQTEHRGQRTGRTEGGEKEKRFRWTGRRASMPIEGLRDSAPVEHPEGARINPSTISRTYGAGGVKIEVFLMCGHPDVGDEPVVVRISDERGLLRTVIFEEMEWRKVVFGGDDCLKARMIRFANGKGSFGTLDE